MKTREKLNKFDESTEKMLVQAHGLLITAIVFLTISIFFFLVSIGLFLYLDKKTNTNELEPVKTMNQKQFEFEP